MSDESEEDEGNARLEIEAVFGLGGGELADEPWGGFRFNYEGVPEWAGEDFPDQFDNDVRYRTVIGEFLFSAPPATIEDQQGTWRLQRIYRSSGEAECPRGGEWEVDEERCDLCGEERGERHGFAYLGEAWGEVVYRLHLDEEDES